MGERKRKYHNRQREQSPFVDQERVKQAVIVVSEKLSEVRGKEGEVIFPRPLSAYDREALRNHPSNVGSRIEFMMEVRLEEGVGTLINIRERR